MNVTIGRRVHRKNVYYSTRRQTYCNMLSEAFKAELAVLIANAVEPVMMSIVCRATLVTGTFLRALPSHE